MSSKNRLEGNLDAWALLERIQRERNNREKHTQATREPSRKNLCWKKTRDGICDVSSLQAIEKLQALDILQKPDRCPHCDVGRLSEPFVYKQGVTQQVYRKCKEEECRKRMNCLTQSTILKPHVARGLSPQQVFTAVKAFQVTGPGKTPGTVKQARLLGCGVKALTGLYDSLREHEARLGRVQCESMKLPGEIECDGSSLRSIRIGPKTHAFAELVKQWKKDHPRSKLPSSFLLYVRVLGLVQRRDGVLYAFPFILFSSTKLESVSKIHHGQVLFVLQNFVCLHTDQVS